MADEIESAEEFLLRVELEYQHGIADPSDFVEQLQARDAAIAAKARANAFREVRAQVDALRAILDRET